ncbi:MAG: hypothetical protein HYX53_14570 [Chloroflexi bacterium]|nr:hypothetical protein [Chloroflexota bacterium]
MLRKLRKYFTRSAEVIEPRRADIRAIEPEEDTPRRDVVEDRGGRRKPPEALHIHPDAKELGKEHRG